MANTVTAYSVYNYDNAGIGYGMAGRILDNGTTVGAIPSLRTGLNGDPLVEGFTIAAGQRIAVTDRTAGTARPTYIYATSGGLPLATQTWANVVNPQGLVTIGAYLYALDYDAGQVVEIDPATYTQTGAVFNFNTSTVTSPLVPSGYTAHGQAILNIGGTLYGLFGIANASFTTYDDSVLVRFTISAGSTITVGATDYRDGIEKNAFAMAVSGTDLYIASIGGAQTNTGYNANSKLQSLPYAASPLTGATLTTVMSSSATWPYEFRDISFNGSTAYILFGTYNASWQMTGKLVSTANFSTFTTINDFSTGAAGYYWAAQFTPDNTRIWFARGNQILVYNAASPATPVATLSVPGNLTAPGQTYNTLNDMSYVSPTGSLLKISGYRSPTQSSQTARGVQARALAQGRPELTAEELDLLEENLGKE